MSKEANGIKSGDYYAYCDVCARKFFGSSLRRRWDNLVVCDDDFEEKHPQDYVTAKKEDRRVPVPRPYTLGTNEDTTPNSPHDIATDNWYGNGSIS